MESGRNLYFYPGGSVAQVQGCDTPALIATQGPKTATLKCKIPTANRLEGADFGQSKVLTATAGAIALKAAFN